MAPRVPRPPPVKSQMGKPLIHKFAKCGHTVEEDKCVPPPKKLMKKAERPSSRDNLVIWDLNCMDSDWKSTVEEAVCKLMKDQIAIMEEMRVPKANVGETKTVKRDTSQNGIIRILCPRNKEGREQILEALQLHCQAGQVVGRRHVPQLESLLG